MRSWPAAAPTVMEKLKELTGLVYYRTHGGRVSRAKSLSAVPSWRPGTCILWAGTKLYGMLSRLHIMTNESLRGTISFGLGCQLLSGSLVRNAVQR